MELVCTLKFVSIDDLMVRKFFGKTDFALNNGVNDIF